MRIVQLTSSSAGGVARHARQVAELLDDEQVLLAGPTEVITGFRRPSWRVDIADRPRLSDGRELRRLRHIARGADVVHAHGLRAGAAAVLATCAMPKRPALVVTLHNLPVGPRSVQLVAGALERVVARGADVVLGVSGDLVARAEQRGARSAGRALVPAPARPRSPNRGAVARVAADIGLGPDVAVLLTVGRLAPQKGLELLTEAAGLLQADEKVGSFAWLVVGDGPRRSDLEDRVAHQQLPVHVLGRRDDVPELMAAAELVVSTSTWEGQPLVVQEALQAEAAIVATDVGGTGEVAGPAARLTEATGPAIAAAVAELLTDDTARQQLRAAARQRAVELPTPGDVVAQLRSIYHQLHPGA